MIEILLLIKNRNHWPEKSDLCLKPKLMIIYLKFLYITKFSDEIFGKGRFLRPKIFSRQLLGIRRRIVGKLTIRKIIGKCDEKSLSFRRTRVSKLKFKSFQIKTFKIISCHKIQRATGWAVEDWPEISHTLKYSSYLLKGRRKCSFVSESYTFLNINFTCARGIQEWLFLLNTVSLTHIHP